MLSNILRPHRAPSHRRLSANSSNPGDVWPGPISRTITKNRAFPYYARNLPVLTGLPTIGSSWVTKP